jgi:hypothetical protein
MPLLLFSEGATSFIRHHVCNISQQEKKFLSEAQKESSFGEEEEAYSGGMLKSE